MRIDQFAAALLIGFGLIGSLVQAEAVVFALLGVAAVFYQRDVSKYGVER